MIFRHLFIILSFATVTASAVAAPKLAPVDEYFLRAYDAFRAGDPIKLQKYSVLPTGHVLAPYPEYWRLKLRLEDMPNDEVRGFLERQAGTYLADRLRADWLKVLGKRADWQAFDRELS